MKLPRRRLRRAPAGEAHVADLHAEAECGTGGDAAAAEEELAAARQAARDEAAQLAAATEDHAARDSP